MTGEASDSWLNALDSARIRGPCDWSVSPFMHIRVTRLICAPFTFILCVAAATALGQTASGSQTAGSAETALVEITAAMPREERVRLLKARTWEAIAVRASGEMHVDGHLDEASWQSAPPIGDFWQRERNEGIPATERTEVRVLYDDRYLYVGFWCYDRQPELVRARSIFRDESGGADDLVAIMLDAYHDRRSAIQFVSNANGLMEDLLQTGETENTRNHNFNTVWIASGGRTSEGFEVEVAIPFKSLRFEPPADGEEITMGVGFKRNIPRKNEEVYWPFVANDSTWYRPAELGVLHELREVKSGRNLQARPYVLAGRTKNYVTGASLPRREMGFDAKWGVTTGLTADFTVNTDFAQEEVDTQQINFTRFSLFFPEKRQLFLENQQMFQFGLPQQAELVFTRRIGLSNAGEIVPIIAGARLAGREGRTTIGALNMQTSEYDSGGLPSENFTAVRVRRDLFARSSVGAVFTNRQGGDRFNRAVGVDANFFFKQVWFVDGWVAAMDETSNAKAANAGYARFAYDRDRVGAAYRYLDVGAGFDPGIGFVRRRDVRQNTGELRWSPRPQSDLVRQFDVKGTLDYVTNRQNVLQTREQIGQFTTNFETGDAISWYVTNTFENLDAPFRLRPGVVITPGAYQFTTTRIQFDSFRRRHARLNLGYTTGGFWDGERNTLTVRSEYRMSTNFGVSFNYDINWVDLPQPNGHFTTHLASSRLQLAFRNDVALQGLLQYNQDTQQFSTNVRFSWIMKPGSEFYVVYNELDRWWRGVDARNRSLVVKVNYLFAM